jgi:hypothetical protein
MLQVGPSGIMGHRRRQRSAHAGQTFARYNLTWYGKILTQLSSIKDAILIIDYPGPIPYTTTGGILFGNFLNATCDEFDLDVDYPPFTRYTDMLYPENEPICGREKVRPPNPAIKSLIINYCSKGYASRTSCSWNTRWTFPPWKRQWSSQKRLREAKTF